MTFRRDGSIVISTFSLVKERNATTIQNAGRFGYDTDH